MEKKFNWRKASPVMAGFFVMGFIDVVGIASNYIKKDFSLDDTLANLMLMMVYLWFFLLSVPFGVFMNRVGRKNTVLISMAVTAIALLVPWWSYNMAALLVSFALIGIGNTMIQVAANPLLTDIVSKNRVASGLTFGQFVKSISSFLGPVLAGWTAYYYNNWKLIFPVFAIVTILSGIWLYFTEIEESEQKKQDATIKSCLSLLSDHFILKLFLGIVLVVGIDVGLNATLPKFLMFKVNIPLEQAGLGTSLYFAAKTIGNFFGAFILVKVSAPKFLPFTVGIAIVALIFALFMNGMTGILVGIFIIGFAVSNIFSVIFSIALARMPDRKSELSGLMMMGIVGGAIIPPVMGIAGTYSNHSYSLSVLIVPLLYILYVGFYSLKKEKR